ncbi:MAG: N-acetylmuramoyl-L-alanine amidase [Halobacteriales archaeon]|nr:N-acetylmuramoyl-L-alanine amidase [Halobacteriales archaeon]
MRAAFVLGLAFASIIASIPLPADADAGSLTGKVIALDAGHGGADSGASGFGLLEKDVNLDTVLRARDLLEQDGATVVLTRGCDCTVTLAERVAIANAALADRFVSVHANACGCGPANGTETYYWSGLAATSTSAHLAGALQGQLLQLLGTRDRGVKTADLYTLHHTSMSAAHVELGFLDNATDNAKLADPAMRQQAARAILFGLQEHFGIAPHDPVVGFAVSVLQPADQAWAKGNVAARGAANQASLHWMRFLVDGSVERWVTPAPHAWTWDTASFADGARVLRVEAENATGVRGSSDITVNVDNTPPVTTPSVTGARGANGWFLGDVNAHLEAMDAGIGVAQTELAVDGATLAPGVDATLGGDGMHSLAFRSTDQLGNAEALQGVDVAIDSTPPGLALLQPAEGTLYAGGLALLPGLPATVVAGEMAVCVDAWDATSGIDRVELRVDGALRGMGIAGCLPWRAGDEALGPHDLSVVAFDVAGNAAEQHQQVVTVPTTTTGVMATLDGLGPP